MGFYTGKKVLLAGGAGFLGSYISEELIKEEAEVYVADNLETGLLHNTGPLERFTRLDLLNSRECLLVVKGMDMVINLAGRTHGVGYSSQHHGEMLYHNTTVQLNMLEAARQVEVERYLCVSSSCVYPDDAPIPTSEDDTTGEVETDNWGYGYAKWVGELQAKAYQKEYNMPISIVRPFNPYGARYIPRNQDNAHVIPALVDKVLKGNNPVVVWGSGEQTRNFLHASDTARLMLKVGQNTSYAIPVNIGYETTIDMYGLIHLICDLAGIKVMIEFDKSKPEGRKHKSADSTLLKDVTAHYKPQVSLEEGLMEIIEWHKASV